MTAKSAAAQLSVRPKARAVQPPHRGLANDQPSNAPATAVAPVLLDARRVTAVTELAKGVVAVGAICCDGERSGGS